MFTMNIKYSVSLNSGFSSCNTTHSVQESSAPLYRALKELRRGESVPNVLMLV